MSLPTVTLTGTAYMPDGGPAADKSLWLQLQAPMVDASDKILVTPARITVELDSRGKFSIQIVPSDAGGLAPNPVAYQVQELFGGSRQYYVTVPSASPTSDLFADLAPLGTPPTPPSAYWTTAQTQAAIAAAVAGGGGSGAVASVNTKTGAVVLGASDVGADPAGAASTAQTAAAADATSKVAGEATARNAAITAETSRATVAEGTNATAITTEQNARVAALAALAAGLTAKPPVVAVSTSNIATLSGLPTVDGQTLTSGQRVLLVGQSAGSKNGPWVVGSGAWTRPSDYATGSDATGAVVYVERGTAQGTSTWAVAGGGPYVVDTNVTAWVQQTGLGEILVGAGLQKTGNTLSPDLSILAVVPSDMAAWVTGVGYTSGQIVTQSGKRYECVAAHTSGTFAADLSAGRWVLLGVDPASTATLPANAAGPLSNDGLGNLNWGGTPDPVTVLAAQSGVVALTVGASGKGIWDISATGALTLTLAGATAGECTWTVYLRGGQAVTWPTKVAWANQTPPTLSTSGGKYDVVRFTSHDGGGSYTGYPVVIGAQLPVEGVGSHYLNLTGASGSYASTPSSAALNISGAIDLRVKASLASWASGTQSLIGKWTSSSTTQQFLFYVDAAGKLNVAWQTGSFRSATSSVSLGFAANSTNWVRATITPDDGTGTNIVVFYTSTDGTTWTQLGSTQTTASAGGSIQSTSTELEVGADSGGSADLVTGKILVAHVLNGINGPKVLDIDFSVQTAGSTSFAGATGETWTVHSPASVV